MPVYEVLADKLPWQKIDKGIGYAQVAVSGL
jgi:hypothetical protein